MIVVTYNSEVLGNGEFWRGPNDKTSEIRNISARTIAKMTAKDGITRTIGMWKVEQKDD